jgi:hypothetical protein
MMFPGNSASFIRTAMQRLTAARTPVVSLLGLLLAMCLPGDALSATAANAKSPLGMNLTEMNYFNPEQPFLNIFKTSGATRATPTGWTTHTSTNYKTGEEAYLQLDANGYPTSLTATSADPHNPQIFTSVGVLLERSLPKANAGTGLPYRAGRYVVLYDGQGTLEYGFDAKLVSSSPGRDVINVALPSSEGIDLRITATDPHHTGSYIRNIRLVKAEEESLLAAGNVFEPSFLALMQNFRVLRAMQWLHTDTDGGLLTDWAQRPHTADAGWGSTNGVPIEAVLQLCNAVGSDCWVNVPHMANDDYIKQMAMLAHANLGASQKIYVEFSNEVWNGVFAQAKYASDQGQAMWPNAGLTSMQYNRNWFGMRTAQMCDIWKSVWGPDASRLICVLGAQAGNSGTATLALDCPLWSGAPCANHNINAVAVAPYFADANAKPTWKAAAEAGPVQLFQQLTSTDLAQVANGEASYKSSLARYNLPFIAYEGGQSLVSTVPSVMNDYLAANRDPRMGQAYLQALKDWKDSGGGLYVLYTDISAPSQYGDFGALESFLDTVSPLNKAPPKWQAIQTFISDNPCWWSGCTGTIGPTVPIPTAPILSVK